LRHWDFAKKRGMRTIAKIQAGTTWEIGSVPYIPAVLNVAEHIDRLRKADLNGLMLSWTLGGYPSPNLEVVAEMSRIEEGRPSPTPDEAMQTVAARWFGPELAPRVVDMWRELSISFREFPYAGGLLYVAPQHVGPANPLWEVQTKYAATMVGFPYDDLKDWRACYPEDVFIGQFAKMADGFDAAITKLREATKDAKCRPEHRKALDEEIDVADTCAIHWRTVANQAQFVVKRDALAKANGADEARPLITEIEQILKDEITLAQRLFAIQSRDSRIGFEASNQYYYIPMDLAEKVLNCRDLLNRWLPEQRKRFDLK
jgi:hypothetical protein